MFFSISFSRTFANFTLLIAWLLSDYAAARSNPAIPLFPLEIFGSDDQSAMRPKRIDSKQAILDIKNPRFSKPDFPGDETGSSPFFYCPESDPDNDIFDISKIVFNPNPPHINYIYVFHAHGYFREQILEYDDPFTVRATVRNEGRDGLDFTIEQNFCDFVDLMEMDDRSTHCPPYKGNGTIHKIEFVDFGISEGNYSLKIDVTGNKKRVFCIQSWFELTDEEIPEDIDS